MKAHFLTLFSTYLAASLPLAAAFHPAAGFGFEQRTTRSSKPTIFSATIFSATSSSLRTRSKLAHNNQHQRYNFALTQAATLSSPAILLGSFSNATSVSSSASAPVGSVHSSPTTQPQTNVALATAPSRKKTKSLVDRVLGLQQHALALSQSSEHRFLAKRAACTAVSCVTTWMLVHFGKLSIVRAAGLHAMVASLILRDPALCTASLSGTFCGMTGLFDCWRQVICLGLLGGLTLSWWEWPNRKIQVGKGGRLGTMGVIGHVFFFLLRRDARLWTVLTDSVNKLSPFTALSLLVASGVLSAARRTQRRHKEQAQAQGAEKTAVSLSKSNPKLPPHAQIATWSSKAAIVCFLLARTLPIASVSQHVQSILSTFVCSLVVRHAPKQAVVFPVGVVCFLASFFHTQNTALMFDMAMGSFVGTTRIKEYKTGQLFQASVVATLLFYTAIAFRMGGRMGLFSFLGVGFGL